LKATFSKDLFAAFYTQLNKFKVNVFLKRGDRSETVQQLGCGRTSRFTFKCFSI